MAAGSESWRPREALRDTPCDMHGLRCDSTASYRNAVTVSHLLKNSSLLTVDGVGHGAFFGNDCVTQYTTQYLLAGTMPEDGAVCHQEPAPFEPVRAPGIQRHVTRSQDGLFPWTVGGDAWQGPGVRKW